MFKISNIRKIAEGGWTRVIVDFTVTDIASPFEEKTMWIAVEDKNADMLTDEVYDAFVLVPLMMGMYYHQDVEIDGCISPRLYHNITHYLISIFDGFSDKTVPVKFEVDGVKTIDGIGDLVGTGISCGVDSLTTIYDNYIADKEAHSRINSLFLFNCGTHGDYKNKRSRQIWLDRAQMNKKAADELGLPMYLVDSNLHAFTHKWDEEAVGFLAIYSCVIALQKNIRLYYTSSALSYDEGAKNRKISRDFDIAEYCETYMPHLVSTERFELVIDGCQYTRSEKIERICDWDIAHKYLNVCVNPDENGKNCSHCEKCMRTQLVLDAMGKINDFRGVFDLDTYHKYMQKAKLRYMYTYGRHAIGDSVVDYCRSKGMKFPPKFIADIYGFMARVYHHFFRKG